MSGSIVRWGAAALVLAAAPGSALGQELAAGGLVEGEVADGASTTAVSLRTTPGQMLQLDAFPAPQAPDGLDLVLKVYDQSGTLVAEDDDGGGALNPRVKLTSEAGGLYRVEVGVIGEGGAFTLLARETVIVPQVVTALALSGGRAERSLEFPKDDDTLFTFSGRRGEAWSLTLVAQDDGDDSSDPMLELFSGEGTTGASIASDDDSGGGLNSRILTELPADGTYTVRVSSLSNRGRARLGVQQVTLRPAPVANLAYGAPTTLSFGPDSPIVMGDSARRLVPYALYRLPASPAPRSLAGQSIVIRAVSEGLDPYLEVGLDTPLGFAAVLSNDDADGLNAQLVIDPSKFTQGDAADWWSKLRIRVSAPTGSDGTVEVSAERVAD